MDNMEWDFVIYEKETKAIVCVVLNVPNDPKFLISSQYVGVYIPHNEYRIIEYSDDGKAYFENLREKILYLDDYR